MALDGDGSLSSRGPHSRSWSSISFITRRVCVCVCVYSQLKKKKVKGLRRSVSESLRNGVDASFCNCSQELDVVSLFKI